MAESLCCLKQARDYHHNANRLINHAALGRAWFFFYMELIYIIFFLVLSVTRPKHPLGHIVSRNSNHTTNDFYLPKAVTAVFNNMRTLKFKAQPTNAFFATVNQMLGGSSQLPTNAERGNQIKLFRQHSRKLGGAAKQLIDGSEKRICRLRFQI